MFPLRVRKFVARRRRGAAGTHLRWKFLRRSAAFGGAIRTYEQYVRRDLSCGVAGCPACADLPTYVCARNVMCLYMCACVLLVGCGMCEELMTCSLCGLCRGDTPQLRPTSHILIPDTDVFVFVRCFLSVNPLRFPLCGEDSVLRACHTWVYVCVRACGSV